MTDDTATTPETEECAQTTIAPCAPFTDGRLPAAQMRYLTQVEAATPQWRPAVVGAVVLGGNPVEDASLVGAAEIRLTQGWYLQRLLRGDVASVVSLAPGEALSIRVARTLRKKLDRDSLQSKESVRSSESQIADREMMDVARVSTRNEQWHLNATAGVDMGMAHAEVSVGFQQSVQEQTSSQLSRVREATTKASDELRAISKVEVTSSKSVELTDEQTRKMSNPYRDRSLNLTFFELHKVFCVHTAVEQIVPVLAFHAPRLTLDRDFIVRNGDFLSRYLVDQRLAAELQASLEGSATPDGVVGLHDRLDRLAFDALNHLFLVADVHFLTDTSRSQHTDQPAYSFDQRARPSGYEEATGYDYANELIFLLGSFYYLTHSAGMLTERVASDDLSHTRIDMVIAMANAVTPLWNQVSQGVRFALFDTSHNTAVFRRIPAFLAMVDQLIKPLLGRGDDGTSSGGGQDQRVDTVLRRVEIHLASLQDYYSQSFHSYLYEVTNRAAHVGMVRDAIDGALGLDDDEKLFLTTQFDFEKLVLSGSTLFIPYVGGVPGTLLGQWFPEETFETPEPTRDQIIVPSDGAAVEASPGHCVLDAVPPPPPPTTVTTITTGLTSP